MKLTNEQYDFWKKYSWTLIPIITFLIAVVNVFATEGISTTEIILAVLTALQTLVGTILNHSNELYYAEMNGSDPSGDDN